MCYVGFVSACRSFCCDLPRVFDWRNSLPLFAFFIEPWDILAILYIFLLFSLRASYCSPSETLVVTIYIYTHTYSAIHWHSCTLKYKIYIHKIICVCVCMWESFILENKYASNVWSYQSVNTWANSWRAKYLQTNLQTPLQKIV